MFYTRNQKGNFRVGMRTEKSRMRRALMRLQDQMRRMRHSSLQEQANHLNQMLRGHYAYYGIAGNFRAMQRVHRAVERYWRKMLSSRSWKRTVWWKQFSTNQNPVPTASPKAVSSLREATSHRRAVNQLLTSVVRENRTLRSVGAGGG
jgi:RNA-directed DNA polymerase